MAKQEYTIETKEVPFLEKFHGRKCHFDPEKDYVSEKGRKLVNIGSGSGIFLSDSQLKPV